MSILVLDVPGYEGLYEATSDGRIFGKERLVWNQRHQRYVPWKRKELKMGITNNGYYYVGLCKNGKSTSKTVHRLIALTFLKPTDLNLTVNHKDGNKLNNNINNLEMVTYSQNQQHARDTGLAPSWKGSNNPKAKITREQAIEISNLYSTKKYSQKLLGEMYGLDQTTVSDIVRGSSW